ncbi:hypothetical protein JQ760_027890 (plasmid) [Klebsiella pneumoniae]|uniref:hypothetical protein n=1 Tax=Klebsiella pneumoniae TaxID=573 RepID=UPI001FABE80E|nr:hypothetical protein [Klebsiella pneumoniae]MCI8108519.1 hypothetical protein [Klebsiella pneumoniae]
MGDEDKKVQEKRPFLFQIKSDVQGREITSLFMIHARRPELKALLDEYVKTLYGKKTGWDSVLGCHVFDGGLVRCRIGRVSILSETVATALTSSGLVIDVTDFNSPVTYDQRKMVELEPKSHLITRGNKMSGRLFIKNFATCIRCSSSVVTGKPSSVDPAWNSAHLYDAMKSEERSFRNIHSVSMDEKLNISWAVPVIDEIVHGEGRCEFCNSYCEKTRTIVSMVVVI